MNAMIRPVEGVKISNHGRMNLTGLIREFRVNVLPCRLKPFSIFFEVNISASDEIRMTELHIRVIDPDGKVLLPPSAIPPPPQHGCETVQGNLEIYDAVVRVEGDHVFELWYLDRLIADYSARVTLVLMTPH